MNLRVTVSKKWGGTTSQISTYLEDAATANNGYANLQQQQLANFLTNRSVENEHVGSVDVADEHVGSSSMMCGGE